MMKKIVSLILVAIVLIMEPAYAKSNEVSGYGSFEFEMPKSDYSQDGFVPEEAKKEIVNSSEMPFIKNVSARTIAPDPYEPNNTALEAFPYPQMEVLSGHQFINGFHNSNIDREGDEDWFYLNLEGYTQYDVILKNLYGDRHIFIWRDNGNGTWSRWENSKPVYGEPEYYKFIPTVSGKYYIQIRGGVPELMYYFFAVEKTGKLPTNLYPL